MAAARHYRFSTERLLVNEWHSFSVDEWPLQDLTSVVQKTLTERVTRSLPPSWQGAYSPARAGSWILERDNEGVTLLAVDKASKQNIGLIVLFESNGNSNLRLGYMLNETSWGKGYASELVAGFVGWCQQHGIHSITGGVERDNPASRRVLEKCGFVALPGSDDSEEQLFSIRF